MISALFVAVAIVAADPSAQPSITAQAGRDETKIRVLTEEQGTVVDIVCPRGIDKATLIRTGAAWPSPVIVRLHLKGLESFQAVGGAEKIKWSVSSSDATNRVEMQEGETLTGGVFDLGDGPHNKGKMLIVDSPRQIPLQEGGYFELWLPVKLFAENPAQLDLQWIDFYR